MKTSNFEIKEDIKTFFMQTDQVPAGIPALFDEFSKKLNGLHGHHLYGITECVGDKLIYRACALENFAGEGTQLGLPYHNIPKGNYVATKLTSWREKLNEMPCMFNDLLTLPDAKKGSICLEDYTSGEEMLLLVEHK
jgi:hypothetical protein